KGADFILANNVSFNADGKNIMGSDTNEIFFVSKNNIEHWPHMSKQKVAEKLVNVIVSFFSSLSANHE
ncbi:MAG: bifunctional phosphopantothenoylcysteine decarboxylase/phosphopantothenate synthase, partial [Bartonella sp.]|nr:bifunctional phosphopantothenoylcysteine decarboxylase/phosphopantothenate synthase [Bartonella sp.]